MDTPRTVTLHALTHDVRAGSVLEACAGCSLLHAEEVLETGRSFSLWLVVTSTVRSQRRE